MNLQSKFSYYALMQTLNAAPLKIICEREGITDKITDIVKQTGRQTDGQSTNL